MGLAPYPPAGTCRATHTTHPPVPRATGVRTIAVESTKLWFVNMKIFQASQLCRKNLSVLPTATQRVPRLVRRNPRSKFVPLSLRRVLANRPDSVPLRPMPPKIFKLISESQSHLVRSITSFQRPTSVHGLDFRKECINLRGFCIWSRDGPRA